MHKLTFDLNNIISFHQFFQKINHNVYRGVCIGIDKNYYICWVYLLKEQFKVYLIPALNYGSDNMLHKIPLELNTFLDSNGTLYKCNL